MSSYHNNYNFVSFLSNKHLYPKVISLEDFLIQHTTNTNINELIYKSSNLNAASFPSYCM